MAEVLYEETAAGRYLGGDDKPLSSRTLQRKRRDGTGPVYIKVGRLVRYRQSDLDAWLADQRRISTSDTGSEAASTCPGNQDTQWPPANGAGALP